LAIKISFQNIFFRNFCGYFYSAGYLLALAVYWQKLTD